MNTAVAKVILIERHWYDAMPIDLLISSVNRQKAGGKNQKNTPIIRIDVFVGNLNNDLGPMSCNATSLFQKVQP